MLVYRTVNSNIWTVLTSSRKGIVAPVMGMIHVNEDSLLAKVLARGAIRSWRRGVRKLANPTPYVVRV